jgi:hypothetical protein
LTTAECSTSTDLCILPNDTSILINPDAWTGSSGKWKRAQQYH